MPQKLAAFWTTIMSQGKAPAAVRLLLAVAGILLLVATGVVFWMKASEAELDGDLMVWTAMFIALGLVMIWTAGRSK